jgi:putative nucleotidyltransferase with HDIG domain
MPDPKLKGSEPSDEQDLRSQVQKLAQANKNMKDMYHSVIDAISTIAEIHDPSMAGHQRRVCALAVSIARELNLPSENINTLKTAAIVHDIGKISVPSNILAQPMFFSSSARLLMQIHATSGYKILSKIPFPHPIARIVYQHHERIDGSGYPLALKDKDILFEAKILAVADVLEAMTSKRPHRERFGLHAAQDELFRNKGQTYDSKVVDACFKLISNKDATLDFIET